MHLHFSFNDLIWCTIVGAHYCNPGVEHPNDFREIQDYTVWEVIVSEVICTLVHNIKLRKSLKTQKGG